ncbi:MAG: UDP-N-acetylglucosamine 1-carboxyvinyltransferase [Hyphomicrobiales bacterium]
MSKFKINGGKILSGNITPQGAKNEALQVICACLLTPEEVIISNVPDIHDVNKLIEILGYLGVKITKVEAGVFSFKADSINLEYLESEDYRNHGSKLRGSVMIMGALLGRFGYASIPHPGGDKIGRRRLDTHFTGLIELGAKFKIDEKKLIYTLTCDRLKGKYLLLDEASVTGTANLIMAASLAEGKTTIFNAACEPYIVQLCKMLQSMGAVIKGIGSNLIEIYGIDSLKGTKHRLQADMIEVGSFIGMAAMTRSSLTIKDVNIADLGIIPTIFKRMGITIEQKGKDLFIPKHDSYKIDSFMDGSIMTIADAPWPGLTPDLISIMLVIAIQSNGCVLIHQKMFESRLFFVDKLIDMGAKIILCDPHRATVIGLNNKYSLKGISMSSPDIRAGVALLIAALSAKGTSIIENIHQIDRGYQDIDKRLRALGADIERID